MNTLRTFSVVLTCWIPAVESICAATSASKAKFQAWHSAKEAGYDTVKFGDFKVRRAPEFDPIAEKIKHPIDRTYAALLQCAPTTNPLNV